MAVFDAWTAPLHEVRAMAERLGMSWAADWGEVSVRRAVATTLKRRQGR